VRALAHPKIIDDDSGTVASREIAVALAASVCRGSSRPKRAVSGPGRRPAPWLTTETQFQTSMVSARSGAKGGRRHASQMGGGCRLMTGCAQKETRIPAECAVIAG